MTVPSPIHIESRRELFVDDVLIGRFEGDARLKKVHPQRREVVFQVQPPNENGCHARRLP